MSKRSGIQLCYPFEERRLTDSKFNWQWPVIIQPKLDGERCRAICLDKINPILLSSSEQRIISVPHIIDELQSIKFQGELDGELYIHGEDFDYISSIVGRTVNLSDHYEQMEYHIFDIINSDPQITRINYIVDLQKRIPIEGKIKIVPFEIVYNMKDLMDTYQMFLDLSYEGIIIREISAPYLRKRHNKIMKFKPKKTDVYEIVDLIEGTGTHSGMVGAFVCQGLDYLQFKISAGEFSHEERVEIWDNRSEMIGNFLEVSYQNITSKGVPRFGIAKQIIEHNYEQDAWDGIL